jgi:phosphomannomutase
VKGQETTIRFGTDGWRALIADEFTTQNVARVAQAHAQYLRRQNSAHPRVIIGYDTRFAGRLFAETVAQVMVANELEVFLTRDFVPTPMLSHAVKHLQAAGGVMITASHNPAGYSGYKIKGAYGGSATPAIVAEIEHELTQLQRTPTFLDSVHTIRSLEPQEAYFSSICEVLDIEVLRSFKGVLVHDAMGGAGAGVMKAFADYANLPLEVIPVRDQPDPMFYGVNPEPITANLKPLMQFMESLSTDTVATVTDGDADRVGAVLPGGRFFSSHQIFCVLLDHLYRKGLRGRVIKTYSTTQLIEPLAEARGLQVLETPIGFKYITDAMLEGNVLIGGEESGGLGIHGHIPERDGILNSLLLLEAVATMGRSLGELFEDLETELGMAHAYDRLDIHLAQPMTSIDLREKLEGCQIFGGRAIVEKSEKDGIKFKLDGHAWVLFRPSGTEPVLRLYSEAPDSDSVDQILNEARNLFVDSSRTRG